MRSIHQIERVSSLQIDKADALSISVTFSYQKTTKNQPFKNTNKEKTNLLPVKI
jgi:hypothetical protein